jgi:hypothetical protein
MFSLIRLPALGLAAVALLAACSSSTTGGTGNGQAAPTTTATGGASTPAGADTTPSVSAPSVSAPAPSTPAVTQPTVAVSTPKATHATLPECTGSQLSITGHFDEGGSAAGHQRAILVFTNTSSATCTLYAYPGVDGTPPYPGPGVVQHFTRTLRGMEGGLPIGHDTKPTLVLHQGTSVSAVVEASDVPNDQSTDCTAFQNLKVTAPDTTVTVTLPINQLPSCNPQVHPVVAGPTG